MKTTNLIATVVLFFFGCATQPVPTREALMITGDQLLEKKYSKESKKSGQVIVKRDSGFTGKACFVRVFINGEPIAELDTEEKVIFHLPPNEHILSAQPSSICGSGELDEIAVDVKTGKRLIYRVGYGGNSGIFIRRTAF